MKSRPPIKLSVLRDIGWKTWDPIGLLADGESWDHKPFADEYDDYLLHIVGLLRNGRSEGEAIAFLDWVGSKHMGLGPVTEASHRASTTTVENIADYLRFLSGDC
jgi:hypothetical protein